MNSLESLREEIDAVDQKLLECLASRFRLIKQMGKLKRAQKLPLRQEQREKELLSDRRMRAGKLHLSEDMIIRIFRILLDESLRQQKEEVDIPEEKARELK